MTETALPRGYMRITVGRRVAVVRKEHEADARALLANGSLHQSAKRQSDARALKGRDVAYAIGLPASGVKAVVRHNRHGGLFGALTRDLFLEHTRAPYELKASIKLDALKVLTPCVLMYAEERVALLWKRADVVTREVEGSRDLSTYLVKQENAALRREAWEATWRMVWRMSSVGARHHDLNIKNVLIARDDDGSTLKAWVLDVDRVEFFPKQSRKILTNNLLRLFRSARKWRDKHGAVFEEQEMMSLLRRTMP